MSNFTIADAVSVFGVLVMLGAAWLTVRGKSSVLWRDNFLAEKARADRLESEVAELAKRVERLEIENSTLRTIVSGCHAHNHQ